MSAQWMTTARRTIDTNVMFTGRSNRTRSQERWRYDQAVPIATPQKSPPIPRWTVSEMVHGQKAFATLGVKSIWSAKNRTTTVWSRKWRWSQRGTGGPSTGVSRRPAIRKRRLAAASEASRRAQRALAARSVSRGKSATAATTIMPNTETPITRRTSAVPRLDSRNTKSEATDTAKKTDEKNRMPSGLIG